MLRILSSVALLAMGLGAQDVVAGSAGTVTVRVLDATGAAVPGAAVGIYFRRSMRRAIADAEGCAVLAVPPEWTPRDEIAIGPYGWNLGRDPEAQMRQPLGTYEPSHPPLELRLPPTGKVRFILYGADERPLAGIRRVHLRRNNDWYSGEREAQTADSVMFDRVPLGLGELMASVAVDGIVGRLEFKGLGPVRPGELTVIEGRLGVGPPVVALDVTGVDGQPVANADLGFAIVAGDHHQWLGAKTDHRGHVELALSEPITGELFTGELFTGEPWAGARLYVDRRLRSGGYGGMAVLPLPALASGRQDLGQVELVAPPILVEGAVVDDEGRPLEGMRVTAPSAVTRGERSSSRISSFAPLPAALTSHSARTDASGRFAFCELEPIHGPVRLRVSGRDDYVVEGIVEARLGERGVEITARRTGSLVASLRGGPPSGAELQLVARRRGAPSGCSWTQRARDGVFRFKALPAGVYDLELAATHMDEPLRVEGVEVPARGAASDARLTDLDWASVLRLLRVRVLGPDGEPFVVSTSEDRGAVHRYVYSARGNRTGDRSGTDASGSASFFAPLQRATIAVKFDGFFHQTVPADRDEIAFELRPAPKVVATLAEDTPVPEGLVLRFELAHPDGEPWRHATLRPLEVGVGQTLQSILPGKQHLVLAVSSHHCRGADGAMDPALVRAWERYRVLHSVDLDIEPGREPVRVAVELDDGVRELLQEAARALGLDADAGGK